MAPPLGLCAGTNVNRVQKRAAAPFALTVVCNAQASSALKSISRLI